MAKTIPLVQGDVRPDLIVTLTDSQTENNDPINLAGATVRMYFREMDTTETLDTLVGVILDPATGLVKFPWNPNTLENAGDFEGEIEITFSDGRPQTAYDLQYFTVREQFEV